MFTVGHSNQSMVSFLDSLKKHDIEVIVDVRSHPFSKYSIQFDLDAIKPALEQAGIKYLYLGKELGGMPRDERFLDNEGHVDYARLSKSEAFTGGITRLVNGNKRFRLALMCGEENPTNCHRRHLIGRALQGLGIELKHIRGDGRIQVEADFEALEQKKTSSDVQQLSLF